VATASVITYEEEQDESLYSVEMTYHDQHEDNNEQQQQVPVPSMTASSESSSSEAEYDDDDDNDHDDADNGEAGGDDSITASDESVMSHVSEQMTIEDVDSEESLLLYSARLSLDDDDDDDDVDILNMGDSTIANISLREQSVEYGGIEYAVKITPPRTSSQRADDETFGTPNNNQSPSSSNTRQQQAELVQLNQTTLPLFTSWVEEHEEEEGEERPLNHTGESECYGDFKDDSMEEQIEAVFCTKKWMSEDDQCEGDIVFTKASAREINGYETSSDSSVVVDHVFGLI
jgi:hypothetical protein